MAGIRSYAERVFAFPFMGEPLRGELGDALLLMPRMMATSLPERPESSKARTASREESTLAFAHGVLRLAGCLQGSADSLLEVICEVALDV